MHFGRYFALVALVLGALPQLTSASEVVATICQIKQSPRIFMGKDVIISGKVLADGMHSTLILSGNCEKNGLLVRPSTGSASSSAHVLKDAVMLIGMPGTVDKEIQATLAGRVQRLDDGRLIIDIDAVHAMTINYRPSDR